MNFLSLLWCLVVLAPVLESRPQYRQRIQQSSQSSRNAGRFRGRGGGRRRRPPPMIEEYDDGTDYEEERVEDRRYGGSKRVETTARPTQPPVESSEEDEGDCGEECRNLLHESDHRKEDARCPYEGMVIDIWGYCRYIHHQERRDWAWWESLRNYIYSNGNSWANTYSPTVHQQMYHQG